MQSWKDKVFNYRPLEAHHLYIARFINAEDISKNRVRFAYEVEDSKGTTMRVHRSIPDNRDDIIKWLTSHTDFDLSDENMKNLHASKHLVLIDFYNDIPFVKRVFSLSNQALPDCQSLCTEKDIH